jgi:putative membrane protein
LTLNDLLAIDRTILANERTLLAYGRTALAMVVIGGSCIKFFDPWWMEVIGVLFIIGGIVLAAFGLRHFRRTQGYLALVLEDKTGKPEHPLEAQAEAKEKESKDKEVED